MLALGWFVVYATISVIASVWVLAAREPAHAQRAAVVAVVASAGAFVQMLAPVVAVVVVVTVASAAALPLAGAGPSAPPRRWPWLVTAGLAVAWFSWIILGTWARQYVWTGRVLPANSPFGSAAAVASAWTDVHAPALLGALAVLVVVAVAGQAATDTPPQ